MLRRPDPRRVDLVVAVLLTAAGQVQLAALRPDGSQWLLEGAVWASITGSVAFRRRYPATVGIGVQTLQVLQVQFWSGDRIAGPPACAIAWFMALYGLAVWTTTRRFVAGAAYFAVSDFFPWTDVRDAGRGIALPFTAGAVIVMVLVRRIVGERDRRAEIAERERDVAAREAVVDERARIARELHDAIAHNVSMMVLQAGAERRVLPEQATGTREVLAGIEVSGRSALTEMRRLVGMLRTDQPEPLSPQPGLADLPNLVEQVREAGVPVELHIDGEPVDVPVGVGLSAYRIVQEALTNVAKHADGASATVLVRYDRGAMRLEIRDNGSSLVPGQETSGGHGLVGMRERVALYGGRFSAGHASDGGFAVCVVLPTR